MSSPIGSKNNVKIFVLYLLENINYPLDYCSINDIVMQTDYVMYLDFAEAFIEMLDGGLISSFESGGTTYYEVTEKGRCVAQELNSDVLSSILDKSLAAALRYLDFSRRKIVAHCEIFRRPPRGHLPRSDRPSRRKYELSFLTEQINISSCRAYARQLFVSSRQSKAAGLVCTARRGLFI